VKYFIVCKIHPIADFIQLHVYGPIEFLSDFFGSWVLEIVQNFMGFMVNPEFNGLDKLDDSLSDKKHSFWFFVLFYYDLISNALAKG
jgi:hypothetical protein